MNRNHYLLRDLGAQLRKGPSSAERHGRILIVDEDGSDYGETLAKLLPHCRVIVSPIPEAAQRQLLSSPTDLVILNHSPHIHCCEVLSSFKSLRPSVPVMVVTDCGSEEFAVQVFRHGAIDYFKKPFNVDELELSVRAILEIRKTYQVRSVPLPPRGLQRGLKYMEANFLTPVKLEDAAREAGMSVSSFERNLKGQTGLTFTAFLNSMRVTKARKLLQTTSDTMLQIALASGFANQSNFNRVFRKITSTTPRAFRQDARRVAKTT